MNVERVKAQIAEAGHTKEVSFNTLYDQYFISFDLFYIQELKLLRKEETELLHQQRVMTEKLDAGNLLSTEEEVSS